MAPTPDLLTCPDNVRAETLSALRDELLPAAEAERLRTHAATCAACRARRAQHEELRRALLAQPELEPGERIVAGVRARLGRRAARRRLALSRGRTPTPLRWSGLGALAAAAAVLLLFVYVLGTRPTSPLTTIKATPSPTMSAPTMTPALSPTAAPPLSPVADVATAWGPNAGKAINPVFDGKHFITPAAVTPDGRYLVGNEAALPIGSVPATNQPGLLVVATERFQPLGTGTSFSAVNCCLTDGRFYVGSDSDAPQATCGVCHLRLWSYDSQTGTVREIASGASNGGLLGWLLSNGVVMYQTQLSGLYEVTLATGATNHIVPAPPEGDVVLLAFTWPYLVYALRPTTGVVAHVRDLSTGQDIALHQLDAIAGSIGFHRWATVAGDTLFIIVPSDPASDGLSTLTTVYELDHLLDPGSTLTVLATYGGDLGPVLGANARVVGFQAAVWDRAERRFVSFDRLGENPQALSGNYLLVTSLFHAGMPGQVALYDTSRLPLRSST